MSGAAGATPAFPWRRAMELGLGQLGLAPQAFWAMTPRELAAAAGALGLAAAPISRGELADLISRFPDKE